MIFHSYVNVYQRVMMGIMMEMYIHMYVRIYIMGETFLDYNGDIVWLLEAFELMQR